MNLSKKIFFTLCILSQVFVITPAFATKKLECDNLANTCKGVEPSSKFYQCMEKVKICQNTCEDCTTTTSTGPALDERTAPTGYYDQEKKGVPGILPECAFNASGCIGDDADIDIFVELGINIAKFVFAIIGTVAFVMFIYGGFTMILSFGSGEKYKKGQQILVAAVVGMFIAFGAYILVGFVLNVLQVGDDFRIIK